MKKLLLLKIILVCVCLITNCVILFAQNSNRVDVNDNASLIGYYNTRYGYGAGSLMSTTAGSNQFNSHNTFVGYYAGANNNSSISNQSLGNTFTGSVSGYNNSTGSNNSFYGFSAGYHNKAANDNVYVGYSAGYGVGNLYTAGGSNVGIGTNSLRYITSGNNNIGVGYNALAGSQTINNTGTFNIGIGDNAGANTSLGDFNIFIGKNAALSSSSTTITGNDNIVLGQEAGFNLTSASNNLLFGYRSGYNLTTSGNNLFMGYNAGFSQSNLANANNTFIGYSSGYFNQTGKDNTFLGQNSGVYYKSSNNNTIVGSNAGVSSSINTPGGDNTLVGFNSGANSYGSSNTLLGAFAGSGINAGSSNTIIGKSAGTTLSSGNNNVLIGAFASTSGTNALTITNSIVIGNNAKAVRNNTICLGDTSINLQLGIGTNWPTQKLTIKGNFAFVAYNDGMFYKNRRFLFQDEQENIALGTNHEEGFEGNGNLLLGVNSKLGNATLNNSTAIGNGAIVSVSNGLVLGHKDVLVGIGTSTPSARLEVASGREGESGMVFSNLKQNSINKYLSVNQLGQVVLQKPQIQISSVEEWSDKVFESNYKLKSLLEVELFVKENRHLPNIPSAQEMTEKGIESDKLAAKLLEKIEELTLYLIEIKKENQELKSRILKLENQ